MNYDDQSRCCRDAKQNYSFFVLGMLGIREQKSMWIGECTASFFKPNTVLLAIGPVLTLVPIEVQHV